MTVTIRHDAADKKRGMSLSDLERFIAAARQAGAGDVTVPRIGAGFSGQLQYLEVKIEDQPA